MIISFTVLSHHRTYGSVYDSTMTSADFSLFVVTAVSLMRPHGISSNTFIVYLQNLRLEFTVVFWVFVI